MNLEYFANEKYAVLNLMFERQYDYNGIKIVQINMQTIADELHCRKMKVINLVGELIFNGFIIRYSPKGKYQITEKGIMALSIMKNHFC